MATSLLTDCVISDPERLGGEPIFAGTRVPVRSLFTYLRKGLSLDQFLDDFEGVGREQVQAVLSATKQTVQGDSLHGQAQDAQTNSAACRKVQGG